MRKIVAAAIVHKGKIYTARYHGEAIHKAFIETNDVARGCQGFIDDEGDFHDRYDAARIAITAGQIKASDLVEVKHRKLFSEDIDLTNPMEQ